MDLHHRLEEACHYRPVMQEIHAVLQASLWQNTRYSPLFFRLVGCQHTTVLGSDPSTDATAWSIRFRKIRLTTISLGQLR